MNFLEDALHSFVTWIVVTLGGGVIWLFRKVLTNEKQIAILKAEIEARESRRNEDRQVMKEIHDDLKGVKNDILDLWKKEANK